jgi:hypothetical protein
MILRHLIQSRYRGSNLCSVHDEWVWGLLNWASCVDGEPIYGLSISPYLSPSPPLRWTLLLKQMQAMTYGYSMDVVSHPYQSLGQDRVCSFLQNLEWPTDLSWDPKKFNYDKDRNVPIILIAED